VRQPRDDARGRGVDARMNAKCERITVDGDVAEELIEIVGTPVQRAWPPASIKAPNCRSHYPNRAILAAREYQRSAQENGWLLWRRASHLRTNILLFATACSLLNRVQNSATAGTRLAGCARLLEKDQRDVRS